MFELTTLGAVDLVHPVRGSLGTVLVQPKRLALLAYLAVEAPGGYVRRDALLPVFWPESDESRARASLRQALQFLRRALGDEALRSRGDEEVGVDPAVVRTDVVTFRATCTVPARRAEALALVRGDFLAALHVDDAPQFDAWAARHREAVRREAATLAGALAEEALARGDAGEALGFADRAAALAPLDERAAQRVARVLSGAGDRATAVVRLDEFAARLEAELGLAPSDATAALLAELRAPLVAPVGGSVPPASDLAAARAIAGGMRVAAVDRADATAAVLEPVAVASAVAGARAAPPSPPDGTAVRERRAGRRTLVFATLAVATLAAGATLLPRRDDGDARPEATAARVDDAGRRVLVVPLANRTGDGGLDALGMMAADWIVEGLSRIDGLTVVPVQAQAAARRALGDAPADSADDAAWQARLVADVGATIVVRGAAYVTGGTLHLQAQVSDARTGALLRPAETVSVPRDSAIAGVDRLRTRVMATIAPVADTVTHLRRAIAPPSYDGYRDYVDGLAVFVQGDAAGALARFRRAASRDTAWPMPRIAAAIALANLDRGDDAAALVRTLEPARDRLGPLERGTLDMIGAMLRGDIEATYRASLAQARVAPGTIGEYMVAESARRLGRADEAVRVLRALGPERGELRGWEPYWRELTIALQMLGDHTGAREAAREAMRRYPDRPGPALALARALGALGDVAALDTLVAARGASSPALAAALVEAAAIECSARALPCGATLGARTSAAWAALDGAQRTPSSRWRHARWLVATGAARAAADTLEALAPVLGDTPDRIGLSAVAATMTGDAPDAARALARLRALDAARSPAARALAYGDVPFWEAAVAAARGDAPATVAALRSAHARGYGRDATTWSDPLFARVRGDAAFDAFTRPAH